MAHASMLAPRRWLIYFHCTRTLPPFTAHRHKDLGAARKSGHFRPLYAADLTETLDGDVASE